jgi:hypothetical protein
MSARNIKLSKQSDDDDDKACWCHHGVSRRRMLTTTCDLHARMMERFVKLWTY